MVPAQTGSSSASRRASCVLVISLALAALTMCVPTQNATGQSLVELYRTARFEAQAARFLEGYRAAALPVERLDLPTDSLREWVEVVVPRNEPVETEPEPLITVRKWELIPKLARSWFEKEFKEVRWAYVGSNEITDLDTTFTRELRARLQAEFGAPTQTIADLEQVDKMSHAEYVQFEYWFVLNDSIPLVVMDVNGPFERGLVVASDNAYTDYLPDIKKAFLGVLTRSDERAAYVDYYYLPEQRMWFLSGYDGERFYLERIQRPDLKLGRPLR